MLKANAHRMVAVFPLLLLTWHGTRAVIVPSDEEKAAAAVDATRPMMKPCDSSVLPPEMWLQQHTSFMMFFPHLNPKCDGRIQTLKLYAKSNGEFAFFAMAPDDEKEHVFHAKWVLYVTVVSVKTKEGKWLEVNPPGFDMLANKTWGLGFVYNRVNTPFEENPIRFGDQRNPFIPEELLQDVYIWDRNTSEVEAYATNGTIDFAALMHNRTVIFEKKFRMPSIVTQVVPGGEQPIPEPMKPVRSASTCCQTPTGGKPCQDDNIGASVSVKWYYDKYTRRCFEFVTFQCYTNQNSFDNQELCDEECPGDTTKCSQY